MRRGQRFSERGRIRRFDVTPGQVKALVQEGKQTYEVQIHLRPLDDAAWAKAISHLASQARYSARLLAGEMPPEVVQVFADLGAPLFPEAQALQANCTCPDWEVPCKHIAALYYLLAERFEEDPFLLFLLRGRSKDQLLTELRHYRQAAVTAPATETAEAFTAPPLAETLGHFWTIGPGLEQVRFDVAPPAGPLSHLKRLGPPPFTHLDLVELLSPIYEVVTQTAVQWAYDEPGRHS